MVTPIPRELDKPIQQRPRARAARRMRALAPARCEGLGVTVGHIGRGA